MRKLLVVPFVLLAATVALAQPIGETLEHPFTPDFWALLSGAASSRNWGAVVGLVFAFAIYLVRYFASQRYPAFTSSSVARWLAVGLSVLTVVIPGLLAGQFGIALLGAAITTVFTTFGAWNGVLKPIVPSPTPLPFKSDVDAAKALSRTLTK